MNIKEIKEMLQLMAEHGLTEIEIEKDGLKIKLRKGAGGKIVSEEVAADPSIPIIPVPRPREFPSGAPSEVHPNTAQEPVNIATVKSPMVGTFYSSPAPDQPVYVTPGKKVKEGDVLCIIEAMKLMNEIKAEVSGMVSEVLAKNGQPVEFDQPLFKIQKS